MREKPTSSTAQLTLDALPQIDEILTAAHVAFRVNATYVRVDRVLGNVELRRDALARSPAQRERQNLRLTLRQRGVTRDARARSSTGRSHR